MNFVALLAIDRVATRRIVCEGIWRKLNEVCFATELTVVVLVLLHELKTVRCLCRVRNELRQGASVDTFILPYDQTPLARHVPAFPADFNRLEFLLLLKGIVSATR